MMNYPKVYSEALDQPPHYKTIMQQGANHSEATRKFVVDEFDEKVIFLCQFCGGESCKHEDYRTNSKLPNAIEGLNSNWITQNILAMQRPSERLIKEFNLYKKFKEKNIRTVLNLQEPGEHPYCGDGIIPTVGFSYVPEHFYQHGIQCFNESWQDMTSTTFEHMMRIMNIFEMSLRDEGKISVHCHAGKGRTLLVICSWLIYHDRMPVEQVIKLAKERREGVLASSNQREFLHFFQRQLKLRWGSFAVDSVHRSFGEFVDWQTLALLNKQKKKLYSTPIVHFRIMRQLRHRSQKDPYMVLQSFLNPNALCFSSKWDEKCQFQLQKYKKQMNQLNFNHLNQVNEPRILTQLLFDYYQSLPFTLLTAVSLDCLKEELAKAGPQQSKLKVLLSPSIIHGFGVSTVAALLDLANFSKSLLNSLEEKPQKKQKSEQEDLNQKIKIYNNNEEALFLRIALLLSSKRKYFNQIFVGEKLRDSKIYKLAAKVRKAVGPQIALLADFLKDLSKEMPAEWQQIEATIFKVRKVESNLYFFLRQGKHRPLQADQKHQMYESARLKK